MLHFLCGFIHIIDAPVVELLGGSVVLGHGSLHIVLAPNPTVFNCFICHLVLLQSIWAIRIDEIGNLLLLCFYIFECIMVLLENVDMIPLDIFPALIPRLIESYSVSLLLLLQSIISFSNHIHLFFLLIMHILHKLMPSLHIFNSFLSLFFFFFQFHNACQQKCSFILCFFMLRYRLVHLGLSSCAQAAHSTWKIFILLFGEGQRLRSREVFGSSRHIGLIISKIAGWETVIRDIRALIYFTNCSIHCFRFLCLWCLSSIFLSWCLIISWNVYLLVITTFRITWRFTCLSFSHSLFRKISSLLWHICFIKLSNKIISF